MLSASHPTSKAERDIQRAKISTSYNALLEEFGSHDLRSVGNYDVGHLIGKGSFGKVYLASHKLIRGSKVVLKSTRKDDANLPREIHHHRQFVHPHIARLYEVAVTESSVWLVLEYCPGDELYHYLTKHGPMEAAFVQKIFAQLVGAVSYVHAKSCVHRDLKLENILLDKNDNVKLVDFGFTREYEGKASYLQTWCGTVCYSAPEMLKGEKYAGEKVDVWSLGIILYALLCGELPFDEDDETVTKMKILKDEPKYPEHLPAPAKELIVQLLSKRPLLRPSLVDVLKNQWLAEHGPQQQAILKLQQPPPFSTPLEADVLQRMRYAGVNTDKVVDNVISQRCDPLAGWWALLLEKEERKEQRREQRRRLRDTEGKRSRRVSAASALVLAPTIKEELEEKSPDQGKEHRGRDPMRANGTVVAPIVPQAARMREAAPVEEPQELSPQPLREIMSTPPPLQRRATRPISASRRRSQLGSGVRRNSSSVNTPLHLMASEPSAFSPLSPDTNSKKLKKRYMQPLASIKQWFKGTSSKPEKPPKMPPGILKTSTTDSSVHPRTPNGTLPRSTNTPTATKRLSGVNFVPEALVSSPAATITPRPARPALSVHTSNSTARRVSSRGTSHSHSPSPLTPNSPYRRARSIHAHSRNSTSSSVSSVRSSSFGNTRGHASKGSTSSTNSVSTSTYGSPHLSVSTSHPHTRHGVSIHRSRSPHSSVKLLPGLPGSMTPLPSNIRISLRNPPRAIALGEASATFGAPPPGQHSPGMKPVFAKRKRSVFRGPMLGPGSAAGGGALASARERRKSTGVGRSNSLGGRLAVTTEEDEEDGEEEGEGGVDVDGDGDGDGDEEMEVEEVDYFSPVTDGAVEIILGGGDSAAVLDDRDAERWASDKQH